MSTSGSIELPWADGLYKFRLGIGQLRELQEKCNAGPAEIAARISTHTWRVDDVREVLRLGLIGGGTEPVVALKLVERYYDDRPLLESVKPAQTILLTALVGSAEDPVGKDEPRGKQRAGKKMAGSTSPRSTERGPQ